MTAALNGQLETGLRVAMLLAASFPLPLDLGRLVLLDHALLHSGDLGGPDSVHPDLPLRSGELGMKRATISDGAELACRLGLASMGLDISGVQFTATEHTEGFLSLLEAGYAKDLASRARWVLSKYGDSDDVAIRAEMQSIFGQRAEEFEFLPGSVE